MAELMFEPCVYAKNSILNKWITISDSLAIQQEYAVLKIFSLESVACRIEWIFN